MQIITTSLTPERAQEHAENMAKITGDELELARSLQQVAFHGRRDYSVDKDFQPAPLYVSQALALSREVAMMADFLSKLGKCHAAGYAGPTHNGR